MAGSLQRPRRVTGERPERRERDAASHDQVQGHRDLQAGQVRAGERQVRGRRQVHVPARREDARALAQIQRGIGHVLDDGVRQHEVERAVGKRQGHAVGEGEVQVAQAALAAEANARILEPLGRIDPDHRHGFLRERQRHAAPAAARVEHAAADGHPRALEKRDDLRAPVVLEQRVVVFGAKPQVRVRFDRAVVNPAHARPSASHASASRKVDSRPSFVR